MGCEGYATLLCRLCYPVAPAMLHCCACYATVESNNNTVPVWPILQAEIYQNFCKTEIFRLAKCGNREITRGVLHLEYPHIVQALWRLIPHGIYCLALGV